MKIAFFLPLLLAFSTSLPLTAQVPQNSKSSVPADGWYYPSKINSFSRPFYNETISLINAPFISFADIVSTKTDIVKISSDTSFNIHFQLTEKGIAEVRKFVSNPANRRVYFLLDDTLIESCKIHKPENLMLKLDVSDFSEAQIRRIESKIQSRINKNPK